VGSFHHNAFLATQVPVRKLASTGVPVEELQTFLEAYATCHAHLLWRETSHGHQVQDQRTDAILHATMVSSKMKPCGAAEDAMLQ
jgi:hypothetical protein